MKHNSLQELWAKGRKRGWVTCDNCGMNLSLRDRKICKGHITGKGCAEDRKFWGLKKDQKFPNR